MFDIPLEDDDPPMGAEGGCWGEEECDWGFLFLLLEDRSLAFSLPPSASSELDWKGLLILENFFFLSFSMAARAELLNPPSLDSDDSSSFCLHAQVCLLYKILFLHPRK